MPDNSRKPVPITLATSPPRGRHGNAVSGRLAVL